MQLRLTQKWIVSGSAMAVLIGLACFLKFSDPNETKAGQYFLPCLFNKVTGLYCPGCGSTRAAHALLNLDFAEAWKKNRAFVVALPFVLFGVAYTYLRWMNPRWVEKLTPYIYRIPRPIPYLVIGILVLYGILRNLPIEPFSALAPQ